MIYVYVGLAGILGALCRYAASLAIEPFVASSSFPAATLVSNCIGCFAIGWLAAGGASRLRLSENGRIAVTSGFVGSFTTFSTFSMETVHMLEAGQDGKALIYVMVSLIAGLFLAMLGGRIRGGGGAV